MDLNPLFTIYEEVKNSKPRLYVAYKNLNLAFFEGEDLYERAYTYLKSHGYLAEWVYRKFPSWTDELYVTI